MEREICAQAVNRWGHEKQLGIVMEEASELIKAVSKVLRNGIDPSFSGSDEIRNLAEEAADMEIMLTQVRYMIGDKEVDKEKRRKLKRLETMVELGEVL